MVNLNFDFVIIGGGTCGLLVANRLSLNPDISVAVIEPGGDVRNNPNVTDITRFTTAFGTPIDWQYTLAPQAAAGNRSITYHAGKAIGGTSTINGMTYVRADAAEIDAWEAVGNIGWSWETLLPYYKEVEQFIVPTEEQVAAGATYELPFHGLNGSLRTGYPNALLQGTFHSKVQEAWQVLGYSPNRDINDGHTEGFSVWPMTIDPEANIREDAARAFYYPVEGRQNLRIIQGTGTKITWTEETHDHAGLRANAVEYLDDNGSRILIEATREVILSAGSIRSPLVLESSGVGGKAHLSNLGIQTKLDLPGVGENLLDQPLNSLINLGTINATGTAPYATFATAQDLFGDDFGYYATSTRASLSSWAEQIRNYTGGSLSAKAIQKLLEIQHDLVFQKNVTVAELITTASGTSLISSFWPLLPFSRGSVHLSSAEKPTEPDINPQYFSLDFDWITQIAIGRLAQEVWRTEPLSDLVIENTFPGPSVLPDPATDEQWRAFYADTITPNHHALGTAAMMSRELGGVVDPNLKVYGTENVRVVDASVIPFQVSGHLTSTLYAIAQRASDIILSRC